jgi:predicted amidophosphoribosyltransferase
MPLMGGGFNSSKRCNICSENWPATGEFTKCPQCGDKTDFVFGDGPSVTKEEAQFALNKAKFEEQYGPMEVE